MTIIGFFDFSQTVPFVGVILTFLLFSFGVRWAISFVSDRV